MMEARRSARVLARIPVSLTVGQDPPVHGVTAVVTVHGVTAVVNRNGALLLSPALYEEGTIFWVRNELSSDAVRCRVTWIGPVDTSGVHKLGIEFIDEAPTFWGRVYEEAVSPESPL